METVMVMAVKKTTGIEEDKNLYIGRAIGAGYAKIDPVRLSTCLSELNLH